MGLCSSCSHDTVFYLHTFNHFFSWATVSICQNICKWIQFPVKFAFTSTTERQGRLMPSGKKKSKIVFHCRSNSSVLRHLPWWLCEASTLSSYLISGRRCFISSDRFLHDWTSTNKMVGDKRMVLYFSRGGTHLERRDIWDLFLFLPLTRCVLLLFSSSV